VASQELALPDPQGVTLAEVRTRLVPIVHSMREEYRASGDMAGARELARRLEAFRRYVADKEPRDLVAAECRRTEILIGHLLGPAPEPGVEVGRGRPIALDQNKAIEPSLRSVFRSLARHEDLAEAAISAGVVARKALLERIQFRPGAPSVLAPGKCTVLVADPPWRYGNTATRANAQGHYDGTLTIPQLCGDELLPDGSNLVKDVVQPKSATPGHLYLWTTAGHLPEAFRVMEAWGYEYKTYLVWVKPQMGMGNYFRVSTELVLFGVRGGMRTRDMGTVNWFKVKRGRHSAKPQRFYDLVAKSSPGPYLELFARCDAANQLAGTCQCSRCRLGWEVWGNQA
jgi:hypothetical protein